MGALCAYCVPLTSGSKLTFMLFCTNTELFVLLFARCRLFLSDALKWNLEKILFSAHLIVRILVLFKFMRILYSYSLNERERRHALVRTACAAFPGSTFADSWHMKPEYRERQRSAQLASALRRRFFLFGLVNLLLAPLIFVWQLFSFFFNYAEVSAQCSVLTAQCSAAMLSMSTVFMTVHRIRK